MKGQHAGAVETRLAKALSHPLRAHILGVLNDRVASPNELAQVIDAPLTNISYHVRVLSDLDCVELVRTAQRRGATEHYYRAVARPFFDDAAWKRLPPSVRQAMTGVALRMIWEDVEQAVRAETFENRPDRYLVRSPLVVDEEGWGELNELLGRVVEEAERIASSSRARLTGADSERIHTRLVLMHFERPPADDGA